jgi:hypothetical protein
VFRQKHGEKPVGWNDPHKAAFLINHGKGSLFVPGGLPSGDFLIHPRTNRGGFAIHQTPHEGLSGRGQEVLDRQDSQELIPLTHDDRLTLS